MLDIYLKVDNATASLITRTIQPLVGTTADHNFTESLKFVQRLNQSTRSNGPGVKGMGRKLEIDNQVRKDFEVVVDKVYARANQKSQQANLSRTASKPIAKTQQTTQRRATQPRTAKTPARVNVAKPVVSSQPQQNKTQPMVPPSLISQESPANTNSTSQLVRATDSSASVTRAGISVLVGGPRDLPETVRPVVSVADSSKFANPALDSSGRPRQSSQR